ncbi:hypothetical protein [Psittacicella gerlachiana]|uniref:Lipoprotein n=1 Tax=Psittacicella gerlachiana TaxID=2028574 RepID=A0A3A1YKQ5_9GAMM|nr:hypothetical protein [Psittacicella gerlachiana]RIY36824.1 hypothetical protein CKF59_02095 [Psittacicella gerlachiana]
MPLIKLVFLLFLSLGLASCSNFPQVSQIPHTSLASTYLFKVEELAPKNRSSLLVVQIEAQQWRWILNDPLGAPLSRMLLTSKGWQREGFVPPNEQAKYLFAAIASYLAPQTKIFAVTQRQEQGIIDYYQQQRLVWSLVPSASNLKIKLYDNSLWLVTPLTP